MTAMGASLRNALTLWRMPSRLTLALFGAGLVVLIGCWFVAQRSASVLVDSLRWFGTPEYASSSVGLGGSVEYRGFRLRAADPTEPDVLAADRVVLQTPGLHWLIWHELVGGPSNGGLSDFLGAQQLARVQQAGGVPRAFPSAGALGLRIEGLVPGPGLARAGDLRWIGLVSGAPVDAEGCDGRLRFSAAELGALGLGDDPTSVIARFEVTGGDTALIRLEIERPGASHSELEMNVRIDDVRALPDANWSKLVILERRWSVRDQGFISARNRWCAARMGVSRDGFVDRHLGAIKRDLAAVGATPSAELESAYRRYAARGGEITWHSRPNLTTPIGQLERFTLAERLRIMNATLESVRGRAAPFRFEFGLVPEAATVVAVDAPALPVPAVPVVGAAPDVTTATAPDSTAATPVAGQALEPASAVGTAAAPTTGQLRGSEPMAASQAPPTVAPPSRPQSDPVTTVPVAPVVPLASSREPPPAPRDGVADRVPLPAETRPTLATASPQPAVSVLPAPTPGRTLAYAELSGLQGRRIEVESTYGSVRRGTLQKYTDTAITIRLEQRERGLDVTMPHQTVREVRLIEFRPLLDDPPSGG